MIATTLWIKKRVETSRFSEELKEFTTYRNVITDEMINDFSSIKLTAKSVVVLELMK